MSIQYFPADEHGKPYWIAYNPSFDDLLDMVYSIGATNWYNFVVVGVPCEISPQWLAKHEHVGEVWRGKWENIPGKFTKKGKPRRRKVYESLPDFKYEYAVSYSIYKEDFAEILRETDNVVDMFNYYLDVNETGKCWREIEQLKLVDRRKPWNEAII